MGPSGELPFGIFFMTQIINLDDDVLPFSVGGLSAADRYRGRTGLSGGIEISLDVVVDNIDFLGNSVEHTGDLRWLMMPGFMAQIPYNRRWVALVPLSEVQSIAAAYKFVDSHRDTDQFDTSNFEGSVDFVLVNDVKGRRMTVLALFDNANDAVLWKMRSSSTATILAA
jgi:hypothetical protein